MDGHLPRRRPPPLATWRPSSNAALSNVHHNDWVGPSVATLNAARVAMRKLTMLTDPVKSPTDSEYQVYANLVPAVVLGPVEHETTLQELLESKLRAADGGAAVENPWRGKPKYGVSPVLSADSTTAWYVCADPGDGRGVEACFLESAE